MKRALLLVIVAACKGGDAPQPRAPAAAPGSGAADAPVPVPVPVPDLARAPALLASPRIDLRANLVRWHLYDRGLVVPVATEGLRKDDLEYRSAGGAGGCGKGGPEPTPLGSAARLSLYLEIPASAYLVAPPTGSGPAKVTVTAEDGTSQTLLDGDAPGTEQIWPLDRFADRLVRLD